jgi:hypothetical protein
MTNRVRVSLRLAACLLFPIGAPFAVRAQQIHPPLHTSGNQVLDSLGHRVRLTSVNWYGFDQKEFVAGGLDHALLDAIITQIRNLGVNSVRLPWANETLERNPLVPDYAVKTNARFRGSHALDVMDAVIAALARAHILIILDNHVSRADWCCSESDGNGLWYNPEYPEENWLADWQSIVRRYKDQPWVIGADLRNELRSGAQWGGSDPRLDWHAAAERGGNAVLAANPNLLVIVESPQYSRLHGLRRAPRRPQNSPPFGLLAPRLRTERYPACVPELRRTQIRVRHPRRLFAARPARHSLVGRRIRHLPGARLRRPRPVVQLVRSVSQGKRLGLELLAAQRHAVQRRDTQI